MIQKSAPYTFRHFITPQTEDGLLEEITFLSDSEFRCVASFEVPPVISERLGREGVELLYVARSRISRLGISLRPLGPVELRGGACRLELHGQTLLPEAALEPFLREAFVPGIAVGRLVLCDRSRRLSSTQVHAALQEDSVRLPSLYSLGSDGRIHFPSQLCRYRFRFPLRREHLISVLSHVDGRELLNFLQVRESVKSVMLPAGEAVITSCAMFLQRHYFLLDTEDSRPGQHFHAAVLDPLETRTSNVFLEFENPGDTLIVNPAATGYLYDAEEQHVPRSRLFRGAEVCSNEECLGVSSSFAGAPEPQLWTYTDRPIDLLPGMPPFEKGRPVAVQRQQLSSAELAQAIDRFSAGQPTDGFTAFCEYFPDFHEHPPLITAASTGRLRTLIFRQAAFDHGLFLSERDHARLLDYAEFGVQIIWLNNTFKQIAVYTQKARRGFFAFPYAIAPFQDALVLGVYGSTVDLSPRDADDLSNLLGKLYKFFGKNIAFLTGGGGGVMKQVLETGKELGCLVGSSFLENADQNFDARIDFYHTFQSGARHMRQRWFEVARCHLFSIGGIGTLEEIGMTLTDIKLGLINTEPIVLFGSSAHQPYWQALGEQLRLFSSEGRGPAWLRTHVLVTDDPDEALAFYEKTLQVG